MTLSEIVEVARRILDEAGVAALTMDRLAREAGISRTSTYRLVGSREALLERLAAAGVDIGERADVRDRVLAAARELFSRQGLESATIEAIAETAEVGPATIYRHFGDKAGLLRAFIASVSPRKRVWATAHEPSGELAADLEQVARAALEHMVANQDLTRLMLLEQLRGSTVLGELSRSPDRTIHAIARLLAHYADRGDIVAHDPLRLARAFQGLVFSFGLLPMIWATPGDCAPEADAAWLVRLFLDGVPRGSSPAAQRGCP